MLLFTGRRTPAPSPASPGSFAPFHRSPSPAPDARAAAATAQASIEYRGSVALLDEYAHVTAGGYGLYGGYDDGKAPAAWRPDEVDDAWPQLGHASAMSVYE